MADRFYVPVKCKPYVRRFLELNFGNPADLSSDFVLRTLVRRCLKKPIHKNDKKYGLISSRYTDSIEIIISQDEFYRYGWELTKTDTVAFGKEVEDRVKFMMRTMVAFSCSLNGSIKMSIFRFQEVFGFQEDIWPYDSIKKEFYRNGKSERIDFDKEIYQKIDRIILENLSKKGTISPQLLHTYENSVKVDK